MIVNKELLGRGSISLQANDINLPLPFFYVYPYLLELLAYLRQWRNLHIFVVELFEALKAAALTILRHRMSHLPASSAFSGANRAVVSDASHQASFCQPFTKLKYGRH